MLAVQPIIAGAVEIAQHMSEVAPLIQEGLRVVATDIAPMASSLLAGAGRTIEALGSNIAPALEAGKVLLHSAGDQIAQLPNALNDIKALYDAGGEAELPPVCLGLGVLGTAAAALFISKIAI